MATAGTGESPQSDSFGDEGQQDNYNDNNDQFPPGTQSIVKVNYVSILILCNFLRNKIYTA